MNREKVHERIYERGGDLSIDYRLDDLGWYQFERMCQALLRARYGAVLEAWGSGSDLGRDAYSDGPLDFPDPKRSTAGPFVFQVKFVSGANAAGARWEPSLVKAVKAELKRIEDRIENGTWTDPTVYVLLTNAPIGASVRATLKAIIEPNLANCAVVIHGATDIAADLDSSPQIRLSYPQILGLRDLQSLISQSVAKDVINRSRLSLASIAELAEVFVATTAYNNALEKLESRHFAVLTGPPEMGKTATAWMIALARFTNGWEVYDCRGPADMFKVLERDRQQLFVADDAFGSTEYRPDIAAEWAAQLEQVVSACDRNHWVIWTSRPGPLKTGLQRLHFQGQGAQAKSFPEPNQVQVNSGRLSVAEKAQILYRHAKSARLSPEAVDLVKANARKIVQSSYFTPLRIQRLVGQIPSIVTEPSTERDRLLGEAVADGLQQPTQAMRTSFQALPDETRSMLVAMLDTGPGKTDLDTLEGRLHDLLGRPPAMAVGKMIELIDDHFVRFEDERRSS